MKNSPPRSASHRCFALLLAFGLASAQCCAQSEVSGKIGEGKAWQTPYFIIDSGVEGPTVVITGGVHGNEPAGAAAAEEIRQWPIVCGKLIVIPRVNTFGLKENLRYTPKAIEEQKDLNRNFPSPGIADAMLRSGRQGWSKHDPCCAY